MVGPGGNAPLEVAGAEAGPAEELDRANAPDAVMAVDDKVAGGVEVADGSGKIAQRNQDGAGKPVDLELHGLATVSYTHLRAHETRHDLVCRLLLEKKKKK